jgi:hypothetical protein
VAIVWPHVLGRGRNVENEIAEEGGIWTGRKVYS